MVVRPYDAGPRARNGDTAAGTARLAPPPGQASERQLSHARQRYRPRKVPRAAARRASRARNPRREGRARRPRKGTRWQLETTQAAPKTAPRHVFDRRSCARAPPRLRHHRQHPERQRTRRGETRGQTRAKPHRKTNTPARTGGAQFRKEGEHRHAHDIKALLGKGRLWYTNIQAASRERQP